MSISTPELGSLMLDKRYVWRMC